MNDEAESHCAEGQTVDAALRLGDQLLEQGDIDRAQAAFEQVEAAGDVRGSLKLAILMERHRENREAAEAAWRRELTKPEMSMAQRTWAGCSGIRGTGIQIRERRDSNPHLRTDGLDDLEFEFAPPAAGVVGSIRYPGAHGIGRPQEMTPISTERSMSFSA